MRNGASASSAVLRHEQGRRLVGGSTRGMGISNVIDEGVTPRSQNGGARVDDFMCSDEAVEITERQHGLVHAELGRGKWAMCRYRTFQVYVYV